MWFVDSSVWIDYFNGKNTPQTDKLNDALGAQIIAVGDIILAEVLQGFRRDADFEIARNALMQFHLFRVGGVDIALKSAENFRYLRCRGITVRKTIDCLIATFVIERGMQLLHADRDFEPFEQHLGLQVIH